MSPQLLGPPVSLAHALSLGSRCLSIFLAWGGQGRQSGHPREPGWMEVDGGGRTIPPTLCHGLSPPSTPKPWLGPHSWPPSLGWVVAALCPLRDHIRRVYIFLEQRQEILGKALTLPPGLGPLQNQKRPHFLHLSLGKHLLQRNPL